MKRLNNLYAVIAVACTVLTAITGCSKAEFMIGNSEVKADTIAPAIVSVLPSTNVTGVAANTSLIVNFSEEIDTSTVNSETFMLKQGSAVIKSTLAVYGTSAVLVPVADLSGSTTYTAVLTRQIKDVSGNPLNTDYSWNFTTRAQADIIAPTILSTSPSNSSSSIALNIKPSVTFSEAVNSSSLTASSFQLKQGTTIITGSISVIGATATFSPSTELSASKTYTATVTTDIKDMAGNNLATGYSWNFTTAALADLTAPAIISVSPLSNATAVSVNVKPYVTFSESVNPSTVTTSTIQLKQGSAVIAGTVSLSGTVATFSPAGALSSGALYTLTVSTGVKDAAGNPMASNFSTSFTTQVATGKSFAVDVVPVLNKCNTCHTHGWTPSSNSSSFYSNLVNKGYVNTTTPTSGKLYQKVNGGHPSGTSTVSTQEKNTLLTWILEGSKNN